jgi:internalin A
MQEEHGVIAKEKFEKLCSDEKIIEMLRLEKVIFYDEKNRQGARYIVPGYLRLSSPDDQNYQLHIAQHSKPCFVLKFRYFIPFGLINQLICLYGGNPDAKAFWRDQIVFTYQSKFGVWIKLDFSQLTISVYINPLREESKSDLPKTARTIFLDIIDLYHDTKRDDRSSIDYPEDMYISVDGKFFIDPTNLNNTRSSTIPAYTLDKAGNLKKNPGGDTQEVELYRIFSNNNNIKSMNKKIFISFSSIDEKYKDEFIKHTKGLQDNRLIEKPFVCSNIELGADWDATIKKEIDECDIMVCLVSVDFLNSDYCRRIEVKKAMEQGKKLISIIIRPCDWETSDFARFQAAYKGKCISLSSQNPLAENSGIEREACWTAIVKEMRKETFQ